MRVPAFRTCHPKVSSQRGVTLIELMIGITIGLLVVVAALGSLVFTQITATSVGDSARLQQKASAAFRAMGIQVRQAGGNEAVFNAVLGTVQYITTFDGFNAMGANFMVHGIEGASDAPDTLRVSYPDSPLARDCLGNRPAAALVGVRVDNQFSVDAAGRLMCLGADGGPAQAIIDGVEDFQVTYNVRTVTFLAPGLAPPAVRVGDTANYRQLTAAAAPFGLTNPVPTLPQLGWSVTVCMQLRGDITTDSPRGDIGMVGCRGQAVAGDGRFRRVYRETFGLRSSLM